MLQGGGGGYVANVIIGILDPDKEVAKQNFLLNTAELDKAYHNTIGWLFNESVKILGEVLREILFCCLFQMPHHIW